MSKTVEHIIDKYENDKYEIDKWYYQLILKLLANFMT